MQNVKFILQKISVASIFWIFRMMRFVYIIKILISDMSNDSPFCKVAYVLKYKDCAEYEQCQYAD